MKAYNISYILCIILFVLYIIYKYCKKERNNIIVSVYNTKSYFGLGDYIRGIIHIYQNENWENIYINYKDNDINNFLYNANNNNHQYIQDKIVNTDQSNYFTNIYNTENYLYHNANITYPIDPRILQKVKNMFSMKPEFKIHFNNILKQYNLVEGKYAILHLRFDDSVFLHDVVKNNTLLTEYIENVLVPKWGNNVLILSNSKLTKLYIVSKYGLKYLNTDPIHTGAIGKYDPDKIKGTLIEFFAMTKSKEIFQYCEIKNQVSGFSQRVSEIYNIPITCIQKLDFAM